MKKLIRKTSIEIILIYRKTNTIRILTNTNVLAVCSWQMIVYIEGRLLQLIARNNCREQSSAL